MDCCLSKDGEGTTYLEGVAVELENALLAFAYGIVFGGGVVGVADALGVDAVDHLAAVVGVGLRLEAACGRHAEFAEVHAVQTILALAVLKLFFLGQARLADAFQFFFCCGGNRC